MVSNILRVLNCIVRQPTMMVPAVDMSNKTVVITGPTKGGIGYETALALSRFGANVFLGARNSITATEAIQSIREQAAANQLAFAECDLANLASVDSFAQSVKQANPAGVDVLICNAGAQFGSFQQTTEQVEMTFAVCALGHHKLIHALKPRRLIWVTGDIYSLGNGLPNPYLKESGHQAYMKACLARMFLARETKRREQEAGGQMEVVCVHPGVINSGFSGLGGFGKTVAGTILLSPTHGAQASILVATAPSEELHQDEALPYYHNKKKWYALPESDKAMNYEASKRLFDQCDEICGIVRS